MLQKAKDLGVEVGSFGDHSVHTNDDLIAEDISNFEDDLTVDDFTTDED